MYVAPAMIPPDVVTYPLREIIAHARAHCPFYRSLYASLRDDPSLEELPVIGPEAYWDAHGRDRQTVLSDDIAPAIVVNSGGTTGAPKHSYFSAPEWISVAALSAYAFRFTGIQAGDRIANLFAAGDLHSSFLLVLESLRIACPEAMQLPLGASMPPDGLLRALRTFNVNVLGGFPTQMMRIIENLDPARDGLRLDRILYAGEIFSEDQRLYLDRKYPGITIRSVGYGSVDAGLIGFADETCALGEHRSFAGATIVELLDEESGQPIVESGRPGRLVLTSLFRRVMPIIRYPVGDMAQWTEAPGTRARRFALLGRTQQSARIGNCDVTVAEMRAVLTPFAERIALTEFQLLVTREDLRDRLTVRVVAGAAPSVLAAEHPRLLQKIIDANVELAGPIADGVVHPLTLEWISRADLVVNPRNGKLLLVVDRRAG